ncbi:LuxR family two component transcriptional regulator [Rhizobium sp. ERR 922]|uniref:DNA-binding response regulator n=1 Tax=Rhizobium dioscoreae TaxID=2653122 RepID=A0ABQ0Z885_9HYPH|nr:MULTISPECIES: response regulator [Rhizobium]MCZ3374670.1 response regulator [Rhizobium sp. AG207R]TWB48569.1 LuxR family two component transcriptional regulator [Rhizobium sp. ERR 922]TWB90290.1 LuxR family two component transcriptional regulator [Rhizobium sp. ERR 942]GES41481.1 DNA-binding response regulator [Rhizobium dioscoreae]GES51547.1 DNA-binding response regulator [Rhizobium dioscoreae]
MAEPALPRDIVLLVDDSPEALGFLTDALEQSGFSVLIATSGSAALNIVERITPDLILLDAVMPAMDGFETCRRLKSNAGIAQIPVVFMTGLTETEHVVHALESGGVDYLTKPINVDELRARIRVHLRNARSAQSARVALDAAGRHLLAVKGNGAIHWSTPQATRLINAATGSDDGLELASKHIAAFMLERERLGSARDNLLSISNGRQAALQFTFLGAIGADEYLFRLTASNQSADDETLRQSFALTQRESEVLLWLAKGKSNRDIGEILGLSARTVNKHLEQIYVKLGVENRASAAVKAAHVLHRP